MASKDQQAVPMDVQYIAEPVTKVTNLDPFTQEKDAEMDYFAERYEQWTNKNKESLLKEYKDTRSIYRLKQAEDLDKIKSYYEAKLEGLATELKQSQEKELRSKNLLAERNKLVDKAVLFLDKKRYALIVASYFRSWYAKSEIQSNKEITNKLARNYYKAKLARKVLLGWFAVTQNHWRITTERKIKRDADYQIAKIVQESDEKVNEYIQKINELNSKMELHRTRQIQQQEEMRVAFLRGVSALNQEAMGIFKKEPFDIEEKYSPNVAIAQPVTIKPETNTCYEERGVVFSKNGLVTRHHYSK
ncbi:Centrosomal protein poc5 [Terramyces sp. JEL0728]|nr:Centrosomal protein poc5 [Terramyces sp. JEL0728]